MKDPLALDPAGEVRRISTFIRKTVRGAGANGVVVGLSGGVDSAVTGALCVRALGKDKVVAALLPSDHTPGADIEDAEALARLWDVKTISVNISPVADQLTSATGVVVDRVSRGNVQARTRMTLIYGIANALNLIVAGTGDRSELALGFFTKWGDGGVDFLPVAHLYKTQVRMLGRYLGISPRIVDKPPSPQLWPGHTAAEELPADYDKLDYALYCLLDRGLEPKAAASRANVDLGVVREVVTMNRMTAHKRRTPPSLLKGSQEIRFKLAKD
jgi:NAD+ synthase